MLKLPTKNVVQDFFCISTGTLGAIYFLLFPYNSARGIIEGIELCLKSVIPSLFPFFVFSRLIITSRFSGFLGFLALPYTRFILGIKEKRVGTAFLLGLVGGFGCGAQVINTLYTQCKITKRQAHILLCCCVNAGPAFVVNYVGASLLSSAYTGWVLFFSLCLSSILCGGISRVFYALFAGKSSKNFNITHTATQKNSTANTAGFTASVAEAVNSTLSLCGYVVLFNFFITAVLPNTSTGKISAAAMLLEITSACKIYASEHFFNPALLCCCSLSLMGVSIWLQVRSLISPDLSILPLILSRILHTPLSVAIAYITFKLLHFSTPVSSANLYRMGTSYEAFLALVFFICAFFIALSKEKNTSA